LQHCLKKYDFLSMPVVDNERRLVGIVTIDDIVDVIEQENTEDFQKMAAIQPSEKRVFEDKRVGIGQAQNHMAFGIDAFCNFYGQYYKKFDEVLQSIVILASFIPMLMNTGGNAGSQSSALIIRGLSLGEIRARDFFKGFMERNSGKLHCRSSFSCCEFCKNILF